MWTICWNKYEAERNRAVNMNGKFVKLIAFFFIAAGIAACNNNSKRIAEVEHHLTEVKKSGNAMLSDPNAETKPEGPLPVFQFETTDHDFGTINQGDIVEYTYKFKNTGDAPLIIQGAQGSCGCTVPNWTKEPIPAGGSGVVTAKFDSHGKQGAQHKTVTVTSNAWPKQTVLHFEANVTVKEIPIKK